MFFLLGGAVLVYVFYLEIERKARRIRRKLRGRPPQYRPPSRRVSPKIRPNTTRLYKPDATPAPAPAKPLQQALHGKAWVIDGDSIRIAGTEIRLFDVDAPEIGHPYGHKAKWAMVRLFKGQMIEAQVLERDAHDRVVARCFLPDGRDLSAELVKQGLAIDWPKFSGGAYADLEVPGIRKKLWLADARQKGRMHVWAEYEAKKAKKPAPAE
ncbi:MAG: thermonuclease family protein [Pseudomonadota bacterium]